MPDTNYPEPLPREPDRPPADLADRFTGADADTVAAGRGPVEAAAQALEGVSIEGYQLLEEIHRGGQGVVYRAIQLGTKRRVALKVLLEGPLAGEESRRRFEREVELAASLRHPNIVTILDSGVSCGRYYFAMEYIDGLRLDRYLAKLRPPLAETLRLLVAICDAVNFAHQRGVIHRDLKPPNILVDHDGQPHILDFGLAKSLRRAGQAADTRQALSTAGELLGTVAYMSPEQTVGAEEVDVRSDVYSLGVVFYEALLGRLPYSVDGPLGEVLVRIAQQEPERPRAVRRLSRFAHAVNDELETILLKALEKQPVRRYQTAGDLARDLRRLSAGEPIEAKRTSGLYVLRKTLLRYRVQAAAAALALLVLVLFAVTSTFLYTRERDASERAKRNETEAMRRAMEARQSRDAAVEARRELERALVGQTIQRGELAQARGDLAAARSFFWEAFENSGGAPAARWALRQYYLQTGDAGANVLPLAGRGPLELSPDGRLAAVCDTPESLLVCEVATGRTVAWLRAAGPVTVVHVGDDGTLAGAGPGWACLWKPGDRVPAVAVELPQDFTASAVYAAGGGERLVLVGAGRVMFADAGGDQPPLWAEYPEELSGQPDYASALELLAVPTAGGVRLIRLDAARQIRSGLIGPPGVKPLGVWVRGEQLIAASADSAFVARVSETGGYTWRRLARMLPEWNFFDVALTAGTIAFGTRDGRVVVVDDRRRGRPWTFVAGELVKLRLVDDGAGVMTVDARGALSRWVPPERRPGDRTILERPPVAWAVAEDGAAAVFMDDRQRVVAYVPALTREAETIVGPSPLHLLGGGPEATSLAVGANGTRVVVRTGNLLRLRDLDERRLALTYQTAWTDPRAPTLQNVALSGDGQLLALCAQTPIGDQQQISLWHWRPGALQRATRGTELAALLPPAGQPITFVGSTVRHMLFKPRSTRLLVARSSGELFWLESGRPAGTEAAAATPWTQLEAAPRALAFDRAGQRLAVAGEDGFVRVLTTRDGQVGRSLHVERPVATLAFDPQGDVLGVATDDGATLLFELESGQRIAQLVFPAEQRHPLTTWVGSADTLLLGTAAGVREHAYQQTDELIARNRTYARQQAVARLLEELKIDAAWQTVADPVDLDPELVAGLREAVLAAALRRPNQSVPQEWVLAVPAHSPPATLARLGHAAYEGERFEQAAIWLRACSDQVAGRTEAYTALRLAQCDYLAGRYAEAADGLARLLDRPDLDPAHLPTVQLQQAAALVLAGRLDEARALAARIGTLRPDSPRVDLAATLSAREVVRYLTGLESESPTAAFVERIAGQFADPQASLRFQDDAHFFAGELARLRGDRAAAAAHYQRCLDLARDGWPANWARYRLVQLSRGMP